VILNDRENADIDRETLRDHTESVAALTGSCVCCEGIDILYNLILKLTKSENHALIVELNGTADPLPLQEGFTLLEKKFLLHPRWQVCVVDARHFGQRTQFRGLENLQLETASHYYLSHTSDLNEEKERELELKVESVNAHASRISAYSIADYLGQAISKNKRGCLAISDEDSEHWTGKAVGLNKSAKMHGRHHLAHEFTGCNIVFPDAVEEYQVLAWMEKLPESVIRAKALVTLTTEPDIRYLYERVGMKISPRPIPVRSVSQAPCSGIFVGADLDPDEILQHTRDLLHPNCYFANQ
jgi:G3E family GTPase